MRLLRPRKVVEVQDHRALVNGETHGYKRDVGSLFCRMAAFSSDTKV